MLTGGSRNVSISHDMQVFSTLSLRADALSCRIRQCMARDTTTLSPAPTNTLLIDPDFNMIDPEFPLNYLPVRSTLIRPVTSTVPLPLLVFAPLLNKMLLPAANDQVPLQHCLQHNRA